MIIEIIQITENTYAIAPLVGAALVGGLGSLVSSGVNMASTGNMNRKNRRFAREMWEKQNAYNSPLEQRKRMEAGGFNPALMYGNGTVANTASPVSTPQTDAPQMGDIGETARNTMAAYMDSEIKTANIDNARLVNQNLELQGDKLMEETRGIRIDNNQRMGQFNKFNELYQTDVDSKKEALRQAQLKTESLVFGNQHLTENQKLKVNESVARVLNMQSSREAINLDNAMRQITLELKEQGIPINSPWYVQFIAQMKNKLSLILNTD